MTPSESKRTQWRRPTYGAAAGPGGDAEALWSAGAAAEEAYEFEAARTAYRAAAAAAGPSAALDFATRYAEFLVERFGQFDEVAAWLDQPTFAPPATAEAAELTRLLARAAAEVRHPRAAELDILAAERGDVAAVQRVAERQAASGDAAAAAARLEAVALQLPPAGRALLERLRQQQLAEAEAALAPVRAALQAGDLARAAALAAAMRAAWSRAPAFGALQQQLATAERAARLAAQRAELQAALAADDLATALDLAQRLALAPAATVDDRALIAEIRGRQKQKALAEAWQEAGSAATESARLGLLARIVDEHGAQAACPSPELATLWQSVRAAAQLPHALPLQARLPALGAWLRLTQAELCRDLPGIAEALRGLPDVWVQTPLPLRARALLRQAEETAREAAEAAAVAEVQLLLDADDLDGAALALDRQQRLLPNAAGLKRLRGELSHARHATERTAKLRAALQAALAVGDVLGARARLGELAHTIAAAERTELTARIDAEALPLLRAKGMPPGVQKLRNAPLVSGLGLGRLLIIQDHVWLTVNLETGGIAPYALPDGWPIAAEAWTRVGVVGERLRLVGVSQHRLVVVEQLVGQPPQVVAGLPLAELVGDGETLLGAALTPDALTWTLLSQASARGTAPTWTRVDAASLAVLDRKKAQPRLDSVAGVDGAPARVMTVAAAKHRSEYALALTDDRGATTARFSEGEVAAGIVAVRTALAWPEQQRVFARFSSREPFGGQIQHEPSLLVIDGSRLTFASTDLRKRFAPQERLVVDHAWTLDTAAERLWFAARSTEAGAEPTALLLGVSARTLRSDRPVVVPDVARILALHPVADGAIALVQLQAGGFGLTRARLADGTLTLTTQRLPL